MIAETNDTPRRATEVDPDKTARFLANLQRTVAARDPDDPPAPKPAPKPKPAPEPVADEPPQRRPAQRRPAGRPSEEDRVSVEMTLDPGTGKRVVYVRVDKTLADRLQLIAFQNKMTAADGPQTINDIGIEALLDWIDRHERRRAA